MTPQKPISPDPFLSALIRNRTNPEPSTGFVAGVMAEIDRLPAYQPNKRTVIQTVKALWPWVIGVIMLMIVLMTSDLSYLNTLMGSNIYPGSFRSFWESLHNLMTGLNQSTYAPLTIAIGASAFLLLGIEYLISRRKIFHSPLLIW